MNRRFGKRGGTRPKVRPRPVGELVSRVLGDLGFSGSAGIVRVVQCWDAAVGEEIASHCRPTRLRGEVLEATVDSSVWCQQLQLRGVEILAGLRREMGSDAPSDLWLRVG